MKRSVIFMLVMALALMGCATDPSTDRHANYYKSLENIAKARADERREETRLKIELIKELFGYHVGYTTPVKYSANSDLAKVIAMMMIFNDKENPYALSYALKEVNQPLPTVGERVTDGIFRTMPFALGIAGAAYGGYLIKKAGEYGAEVAVAATPATVSNSTTTTNEHYNVNSYNSQEANMGQSNSGGAGPGGNSNADSGNQGNIGVIGQSQDFSADNPAMRSTGYQAPFNEPIPVVVP